MPSAERSRPAGPPPHRRGAGPGTLLGIWAHPDDEAYLSAGLMARTTAAGGRVVCAFATRGEAGTDDPVRWPPARLAVQRDRELRSALAVLGVEAVRYLGHRDGGCAGADPALATAGVAALLDEVDPDVVVTFGPDGVTGHPDHRAVSAWVRSAWSARHGTSRRRDLLLATLTPGFLARHADLHDRIGLFPDGPPEPTPDGELALAVDLDDRELDRKRAALAAHASQTGALAALVGEEAYRRWWSTETFRWPTGAELGAREVA